MYMKWFILGLIIVALISALSSPGKIVEIQYALHAGMPSIFNPKWNGTSYMGDILSKAGYNIVESYSIVDSMVLARTHSPDRIIYVYIAPSTPLTQQDYELISELMQDYELSLIVADEANTSNSLLGKYGISISGAIIRTTYGSPYPVAIFDFSGTRNVVLLNYASSIGYSANTVVIGRTLSGQVVGVAKRVGDDDMVLVVSDSSLFINLMLLKSSNYMNYTELVLNIFKYASMDAEPEKTLVILDESHYPPPSPERIAKITGRSYIVLHPLILLQLAATYSLYAEEAMYGNPLILMGYLLTALSLILVVYHFIKA